jgi:hypothetical protein
MSSPGHRPRETVQAVDGHREYLIDVQSIAATSRKPDELVAE